MGNVGIGIAIVGLGLLAGCVSYEQRIGNVATSRCEAAGLYPGDAGWSDCYLSEVGSADAAQQRSEAMWGATGVAGATLLSQPRVPPSIYVCGQWGCP